MITTAYLPVGIVTRSEAGGVVSTIGGGNVHVQLPPGGLSLEAVEMSLVRQAIEQSNGNQTRAAELLNISRDQLRYRLKKLEEGS